eukprot:4132847-Pleurochrysis_carterae.AAC.2
MEVGYPKATTPGQQQTRSHFHSLPKGGTVLVVYGIEQATRLVLLVETRGRKHHARCRHSLPISAAAKCERNKATVSGAFTRHAVSCGRPAGTMA